MKEPVILFDGVCNFCSDGVRFVIARNRSNNLRFCQLQSEKGKQLLAEHGLVDPDLTSMAFIVDNQLYLKSTAALKVLPYLSMPWPVLYLFILVPVFIRNRVYDWFGRNRYRWFGKKSACWIPDVEIRQRFLE